MLIHLYVLICVHRAVTAFSSFFLNVFIFIFLWVPSCSDDGVGLLLELELDDLSRIKGFIH
jgi:hypothetical protein